MVLSLPIESISWSIKGPLNLGLILAVILIAKFGLYRDESIDWLDKSWFLIRNILPKLLLGVFLIGILEPFARQWMIATLTNNSLLACFFSLSHRGSSLRWYNFRRSCGQGLSGNGYA